MDAAKITNLCVALLSVVGAGCRADWGESTAASTSETTAESTLESTTDSGTTLMTTSSTTEEMTTSGSESDSESTDVTSSQTESETFDGPACGNEIVEGGEECDDGAENSDDGSCTVDCKVAVCGDGLVWAGEEECDDGADNSDNGACTSSCALAICGDGLLQYGVEECEPSPSNKEFCTDSCEKSGLVVFVSSETTTGEISEGNLVGIEAADAICQRLALESDFALAAAGWDDDGQPWPYKAWLSSSTLEPEQSPAQRFPSLSGDFETLGYRRVDNSLIASSPSMLLSGALLAPISLTETGGGVESIVWTATREQGVSISTNYPCSPMNNVAWSSEFDSGIAGISTATNTSWTHHTLEDCNWAFPIYCFEQPPPPPEP